MVKMGRVRGLSVILGLLLKVMRSISMISVGRWDILHRRSWSLMRIRGISRHVIPIRWGLLPISLLSVSCLSKWSRLTFLIRKLYG